MFLGNTFTVPNIVNLPGQSTGGGGAFEYTAIENSFSMEFDGATSQFLVTDDIFGGMTEFTIAFWYYADNITIDRTVLAKWTTFGDIILYHKAFTGWRILYGGTPSGGSKQTTILATAGTWQHLVCKYDGSEIKFYLNGGATTESGSAIASTLNSFTNMNIGIDPGAASGGRPWDGKLDELAIWGTALSDTTVQAIYNATANNPGKVADLNETPEGAPTAWYRMGD